MDIRSFSINYETNLVVYDETITRELEADFERDIDSCVDFSVSIYDAQPLETRLLDSVMRLCFTAAVANSPVRGSLAFQVIIDSRSWLELRRQGSAIDQPNR